MSAPIRTRSHNPNRFLIAVCLIVAIVLPSTALILDANQGSPTLKVGTTAPATYTFVCHGFVGVYMRSTNGISTTLNDPSCTQ